MIRSITVEANDIYRIFCDITFEDKILRDFSESHHEEL
jgi:hypothetical protein